MSEPTTRVEEFDHTSGRGAAAAPDAALPLYQPETPLGRRLMELHEEIVASGQPLIGSWAELEREIAERRGGQFDRS
jgi:hypothetical protein